MHVRHTRNLDASMQGWRRTRVRGTVGVRIGDVDIPWCG